MRPICILAAVFALSMPTLAAAQCAWGVDDRTTMRCPDGAAWDAESGACVPVATS